MPEKSLLNDQLEEFLTELSCNLYTLKHCFELLHHCFENDAYAENKSELYCFMIVLKSFIEKIKTDYEKIQIKLGIST